MATTAPSGLAAGGLCAGLVNVCSFVSCESILAPYLIGTALSVALCVVVVTLGVRFIRNYADGHHRKARIVVAVVLILNVGQTALHLTTILEVFGEHWGDFSYFIEARFSDAIAPLIGVLLQLQAQLWMLGTASELTQKRIRVVHSHRRRSTLEAAWSVVAVCTTVTALVAAAAGCAMSILLKLVGSLNVLGSDNERSRLFYISVPIHFAFATVADVFLAGAISYQLYRSRDAVRQHIRTQRLRQRARTLIATGIIVAALQLGALVLWYGQIAPAADVGATSSWVYLPMFALGKVYGITFITGMVLRGPPRPDPQMHRMVDQSIITSNPHLLSPPPSSPSGRQHKRTRTRTASNEGERTQIAPWTIGSASSSPDSLPSPGAQDGAASYFDPSSAPSSPTISMRTEPADAPRSQPASPVLPIACRTFRPMSTITEVSSTPPLTAGSGRSVSTKSEEGGVLRIVNPSAPSPAISLKSSFVSAVASATMLEPPIRPSFDTDGSVPFGVEPPRASAELRSRFSWSQSSRAQRAVDPRSRWSASTMATGVTRAAGGEMDSLRPSKSIKSLRFEDPPAKAKPISRFSDTTRADSADGHRSSSGDGRRSSSLDATSTRSGPDPPPDASFLNVQPP